MANAELINQLGGKQHFHSFIAHLYDNMLDDYRINRFFNHDNANDQKQHLEQLLTALLLSNVNTEQRANLLDNYFSSAFSRSKRKSFTSAADWSFFGEVIEQDEPNTEQMSDGHFFLLRMMPDDENYDVFLENLQKTLHDNGINSSVAKEIMSLAENSREAILGRQIPWH